MERRIFKESGLSDDVRMFFMGSPLIDVTANVDGDFLKKYGFEPDNAYAVDENNRGVFEEIRAIASVQIGGSVTNTARTFKKLSKHPKLVTYLGTIGNDEYGRFIKSELEKEMLGDGLMEIEGNTGKVAVLLNGKTRTLLTDLGVSRTFTLCREVWGKMDSPCLIYLSGFFVNVSFEIIADLINKNKTLVFNLGAPFLCEKFPEKITHIYRNSSIIFGNESEHRAFAKIHNTCSKNLKDVIISTNRKLDNQSRVIVVTRGGGPVLVVQDSDWQEFDVEFLDDDKIVDTNGAGDAFAGGFLARYVAGDSVANCVKCGSEMARKIIQTVGFVFD